MQICYFYEFLSMLLVSMFFQILRLRRIERGALTLASAEVKFQVDTETHDPLDIGKFEYKTIIF